MVDNGIVVKCNSEDCIWNKERKCTADVIEITFDYEVSIKARVECPYEQK